MANALYGLAREKFLGGDLDWDATTTRIALVNTTGAGNYTVSIDTHEDLADVTADGTNTLIKEATSSLTSLTKTLGVADAADYTWVDVTGVASEAIIIYKYTGAHANDTLIAYIDTATSGLPVTPNGGDITVQWSSGANKIFKL